MDFIKGYKTIDYGSLKSHLIKAYEASGKSYIDLAKAAEVTSTQTIKFIFDSQEQKVSDKVLTSVSNTLGINAFIIWMNGEKYYYMKSK